MAMTGKSHNVYQMVSEPCFYRLYQYYFIGLGLGNDFVNMVLFSMYLRRFLDCAHRWRIGLNDHQIQRQRCARIDEHRGLRRCRLQ